MTQTYATVASPRQSLEEVVEWISEVSTLPRVVPRVRGMGGDPKSAARDLREVLGGDTALSEQVLRCVNLSAYAARTESTNLQQAIACLGTSQIRNLALTAGVSGLFAQGGTIGRYNRIALWRHLVAVGVCARMIAMRFSVPNFEDVFLAGLLHDVGIILEDQHLHDDFAGVIRSLDGSSSLVERERECWGFDHTMLAEAVLKRWDLSQVLIVTARHHHDSTRYRGEHQKPVWCVEVANLICSLQGFCSVGANLVKLSPSAISGLALRKEDVVVLAGDLERELLDNRYLFQC